MHVLSYVALIAAVAGICSANIPPYAATIRAPSYPLAVRTPYSSIWLPADTLPGKWPRFWTGTIKGWTGMVRVDGVSYVYMGNPAINPAGGRAVNFATQTSAVVTPTQTLFAIQAGPVQLNVTFLSPVEYEDVERQSIPLSYVFVTVEPEDGRTHNVQLYMDISAEWATSQLGANVTWSLTESPLSKLKIFTTEMQTPKRFGEFENYPQWGQAVLVTSGNAQYQSGSDLVVRGKFVDEGKLDDFNDTDFRPVNKNWPTFAFVHDLGNISRTSNTIQYVVGHIREENINLRGVPQKALWTHYFGSQAEMIDFFYNDVVTAIARATSLDIELLTAAYETEGQAYADIIALSLRQAYAGTEFSGNKTHPVLYLKEISSNGNMQTVDVMYPAVPMFYYMNVDYLKYLLEPLFLQMEDGFWTEDFSMHDIGSHFPNATGHDGGEGTSEDMPCEESANMLLMVANIALHPDKNVGEEKAYVLRHYATLEKWALYLHANCLYPRNQLTTDDFIGRTQLNSGLALKSILGMKAFARLSTLADHPVEANFYNNATSEYIDIWFKESFTIDADLTPHLKMEYNKTDGYQFKYNAYMDKVLSLNAVPQGVYSMEAAYYLGKAEEFGIPFVSTHIYTKSDWEMWTAAAFGDVNPLLRTNITGSLSRYLNATPSRVAFSDWYVTANGETRGFKTRPVVGGHFALLALNKRAQPAQ